MRRSLGLVVVLGLAVLGGADEVRAQDVAPICTDRGRECLLATVELYLNGIENRDDSKVPFAPNVTRIENGYPTGIGEKNTRSFTPGLPAFLYTDRRYFIDEQTSDVFLFAIVRAPEAPDYGALLPPKLRNVDLRWRGAISLQFVERFRIEKGLITQVEVIGIWSPGLLDKSAMPKDGLSIGSDNWPYRPLRKGNPLPLRQPALCTSGKRDCLIKTASTYVDGIANYDLSRVPVTQDWVRTEVGRVTGSGRAGTELGRLPRTLNWIGGAQDTRFFVDEKAQNVVVFTMFRSSDFIIPSFVTRAAPVGPMPLSQHTAIRFHIEGGLISEIEELYSYSPDMNATNWPASPRPPSLPQ